jgi:nucleotide-binding universal stress UspA family protein
MFSRILVAVDFSAPTEAALARARALAEAFQSQLHLLHVLPNVFLRAVVSDPHRIESAMVDRWLERAHEYGRPLRAIAAVERSDDPAEAIVRYARNNSIELIVIGTHGRRGLAHALKGSVAEQVTRRAPCPVLSVHEQSPVQRQLFPTAAKHLAAVRTVESAARPELRGKPAS